MDNYHVINEMPDTAPVAHIDTMDSEEDWMEIKVRCAFLTSEEGFVNFCSDLKNRRRFTATLRDLLWRTYKGDIDLTGATKVNESKEHLEKLMEMVTDLTGEIQGMMSTIAEQETQINRLRQHASQLPTQPGTVSINNNNNTEQNTQTHHTQQLAIDNEVAQLEQNTQKLKESAEELRKKAAIKGLFDSLDT